MSQSTTAPPREGTAHSTSSFAKSLFLGEVHEDLVLPFPYPSPAEAEKIKRINRDLKAFTDDYDELGTEDARWVSEDDIARLGEIGALGLYVPEKYGGQGLSQTGYARVFETIAHIDPTLSVVLGVHQSIGYKGIALFGTDEQKERWLPDLATGKKLAAFALTEESAGSDAWGIESRAVLQADGSYRLSGKKRYIGNGSRADVLTTFARVEINGKDRHIALLVEKGMKGFEVGDRYDTMGLRANDLRQLTFNEVRIPPENVLGEPGDGFRIAMAILNNGRIGLGTGSVGGSKLLLDMTIEHVSERRQFGAPLADLELVQEKIGWMVANLFGLESMCYLTTGLVDAGVEDYSIESAVCKIAGTEFLWYQANRALQLAGGAGYMRGNRYEKILRDIRIFPIFEGANDVLRSYVALTGMKPLGEKLSGLGGIGLGDPIRSIGVLADYVGGRIRGGERLTHAHPELKPLADSVGDQVGHLRSTCEKLLREHRKAIIHQGLQHRRISDAVAAIFAQVAVISRVTALFGEQGVEASGQEMLIAKTYCSSAASRTTGLLNSVERNSDATMRSIARLAYKRGSYGYELAKD